MSGRSTRTVVSLILLLLLLAIPGSVGVNASEAERSGHARTTALISGGEDQGFLVVTPAVVRTNVVPPDKLWIPVFVTVPKGGKAISLEEVTVEVGGHLTRLDASATLEPQDAATSELVKGLEKNAEAPALLKKGKYMFVEVDVSGLPLKEGDIVRVAITARGSDGERKAEATVTSSYAVMSLPTRADWYAGDGHIHSSWSPDVRLVPISSRTSSAKSHGLKWIVITDHEDGIDDLWLTYVAQCGAAQNSYQIPVLPGLEVTAEDDTDDSDVLGYGLSETNPNLPDNRSMPPQDVIDAINNHNSDISYAFIAHPYGLVCDWDDWTVTGFRGIELFSGTALANQSAVNKWFSLLRSGLASTMSNGAFTVGIGGSDCHNLWGPGDVGMTWAHIPGYTSSDRTKVWDAIRAGRASASGSGNLGCFSVNNMAQGSIVSATQGSKLTFKLIQQPETFATCEQIVVFNKNQSQVKAFLNPETETPFEILAPSADDFYVVKFVFRGPESMYYEVWANPIFVDVT